MKQTYRVFKTAHGEKFKAAGGISTMERSYYLVPGLANVLVEVTTRWEGWETDKPENEEASFRKSVGMKDITSPPEMKK